MEISLAHFLDKQWFVYDTALKELKNGQKESHWMWSIFPQLRGLGESEFSFTLSIKSIREAKEYLSHPILGARLVECSEALLLHKDKTAVEILGHIDAMKLRSSMTLFSLISDEDSVFHKVLAQFYRGEPDKKTLDLVFENDGFCIRNGILKGYYGDKTEIVVPEFVTEIGELAFYNHKQLHSIILPDNIESICDHAFAGCENLRSINTPESIKYIGNCAFSGCKGLADENGFVIVKSFLCVCYNTNESHIEIPDGVTMIDSYAFSKCRENMQTVVVPQSVTTIYPFAFWRCKNLQKIVLPESMNSIALNAFLECENITICAPTGSYAEAYAHHVGIPFEKLI